MPLEKQILGPTSSDHPPLQCQMLQNLCDMYTLLNISCPVSPVGSPHLHPMSPQHISGQMSPSPLSSPRTTSGSSTPLTGGIGAVPFHHQPMSSQEGYGNLQMRPPCHSYWDPDILRGVQSGSHAFRELTPYDNDGLGKQFVRNPNGDLYDRQSVLTDRVSQQQLRDPVKSNQSLNLAPPALPCHRTAGE